MPDAYDPDNVFSKILRGELPAVTVYEDDHTLAFMDIMPATDGHTLIIPKGPHRTMLDCPDDLLKQTIVTTRKIAIAAQKAFAADGITVSQLNEAAGGQEVFHLHFHVIPRKEDEPMRSRPRGFADKSLLIAHAERIKSAL